MMRTASSDDDDKGSREGFLVSEMQKALHCGQVSLGSSRVEIYGLMRGAIICVTACSTGMLTCI